LRDGALGFFFGQAAEVIGHVVEAGGIQPPLQRMGLGHADQNFVNDLPESLAVGQR
jgi:hypothetical protein